MPQTWPGSPVAANAWPGSPVVAKPHTWPGTPKAPAAQPEESLWRRTLNTVEGLPADALAVGKGIVKSYVPDPALKAADEKDYAARKRVVEQGWPVKVNKILADYLPGWVGNDPVTRKRAGLAPTRPFNGQVSSATSTLGKDFTTPLDKRKGLLALPARAGKAALDTVNVPLSVVTGALADSPQTEPLERYTGISRDSLSNLPLLVDGGAGAARGLGKLATRAGKVEEAATRAGKVEEVAASAPHPKPGPQAKITRPEFVDEHSRKAAPVLSRALARADLAKRQHMAKLEPLYKAFNDASDEDLRDVKRHLEGAKPKTPLTPERLKAAEALKSILSASGEQLKGATGVPLRENYFPGKWLKDGKEAEFKPGTSVSKVGTGTQLKAKKFASVDEGITQGLKEKFPHPVEAVANYLEDTYNRIGHEESIRALRDAGLAKWFPERSVPEGHEVLKGPSTVKDARAITKDVDGIPMLRGTLPRRVLAAPKSVATLHNNRLAPGLADSAGGWAYKPAKVATGLARTTLLAGGSLAHTALTSLLAGGSDLARGADALSRGRVGESAAALGSGALMQSPFRTVSEGVRVTKRLLEKGPQTEAEHLLVDSGHRVGQTASYENSLRPNLYESARRKTFKADVSRAFRDVATKRGGTPWQRVKNAGDLFSRTLETANHFTFKYQVPHMKTGVALQEIEHMLKMNPKFTAAEKLQEARKIEASVDSRFGEVVRDNNFWHTYYVETSRLALLSPSWVQGNVRLFADAAKDIPRSALSLSKGKGMGVDTQAAFGVLASRTLAAGMLTYVLTNSMPSGLDWVSPRTGGTTKDGKPERMTMLSSMKDLDQLAYGDKLTDLAYGKLNPAVQAAYELGRDKDYFGHPIYGADAEGAARGGTTKIGRVEDYLGGKLSPIGFKPNANPNTALPAWSGFLGVQSAGQKFTDPEKYKRNQEYFGGRDFKAQLKRERKASNQSKAPAAQWPGQPIKASDWPGTPAPEAPIKQGAANAGKLRPEMQPVAALIRALPGVKQITAENDSYHPASDVHGQGKAVDFSLKGGKADAAAFASRLRQQLAAQGFKNLRVIDEYNNPSARATAGHIHVQMG